MKRFLSRFSAAGPTSPAKPKADPSFDRSEKLDVDAPCPAPAILTSYNTVGRTKALVAKFETSPSSRSEPSHTPSDHSAAAPQLTIPIRLDGSECALPSPAARCVPSRVPGSSLPADASNHPSKVAGGANSEKRSHQPSDQERSLCQPSVDNPATSSATHASKTVAFAPSPQKQRSTSPAQMGQPQRTSIPPSLSRTNSNDSNPVTKENSFARPTAASQARSRVWTRSVASDASQLAASTGARDKGPSSLVRSSRPNHGSSARSTARRSYSYSSAAASRPSDPSATSSTSVISGGRTSGGPASVGRATSIDLAQPGRTSPTKRADSDVVDSDVLLFPTRTSLPTRMGYSDSASNRPTSRRNSVDPIASTGSTGPLIFPPSGGPGMRSFGFPTWSEMTNEELVRNLGPRERTRQEVLWEIVASEERYVIELEKAKDLYIDALLDPDHFDPERVLPPALASNAASPIEGVESRERVSTPKFALQSKGNITALPPGPKSVPAPSSSGDLPIAARFMSNISAGAGANLAPRKAPFQWDMNQVSGADAPYLVGVAGIPTSESIAAPSVAQKRVEAAYGLGLGLGTRATRDRSAPAYMNAPVNSKGQGKASKAQKLRSLSGKIRSETNPLRLSVPLPPSLREVLLAMSDGLLDAHGLLSDTLKARYQEQWPLVRSLADVFMGYSHILEHYASYVCHLQRAMEELEEAALMERAFRGKRLKKERLSNTVGLGRTVAALEACAAEQGFAGLSIFVSMPFQRLLKYPLLFQNLLFHTDPSTHEFENTVAMVVEVERLVRSIEDEKVNAEERDKTRDVFARIDGITDRQVLRPRPDRILIEETALYDEHARRALSESAPKDGRADMYFSDSEGGESSTESSRHRSGPRNSSNQSGLRAALRSKRSYRRLSDFVTSEEARSSMSKAPAMGSKKDLWLIRFSDVEIKCQRIGVTALPMVSTAALRNTDDGVELGQDGVADFSTRSKDSRERLKALRNTTLRAKTRNLYKYVSVVAWRNVALRHVDAGREGLTEGLPTAYEHDEEDDEDEDEDDGASISSGESSASSSSSSSGSSGRVGGQVGSEKYIRSTKLSFTYWGDRIEPGHAIAGNQSNSTSLGKTKASSVDGVGRRKEGFSTASATRGSLRQAAASTDSAITTGSTPSVEGTQSGRRARWSTPNGHSSGISRSGGRSGGMCGRLSEPLAATSMSTAPESMQTAVAQMHARQRNDKFGRRLRSSVQFAATVASTGDAGGSHVSSDVATGGANTCEGDANALPKGTS